MVLPLMSGGDVEGLIDSAPDHRIPLEQAIEITRQVCRGLEFAHSKGIVHRDLKPANVWLTADPSTGSGQAIAKIGDFGLAVATDRSRLTQEGMIVGTVSYMPPEQAMGSEVTAQADLYSLGAMLYEMITGRPPFVGDDSVAIIGQHLNTPPVAPTWHNPDVPPGLEALVLRLLEKDPASRPSSAAEVGQALDAIDVGAGLKPGRPEGVAPAGPDPTYRRTFVGREAELRQLHAAFDGAMSGEGSLVMVVGEPGIGKTSLCEQLATYATLRSGRTVVGHCYEEGSLSLPYLAFVEAMRSYVLSREPEGLKEELGSGASEVARIVSEVRERVQVEPRPSGDPEEDRYRLMHAVTSFLRNAAGVQPLVIVLEDLHDADRGTLDMLRHVARNLPGSRLMLVGTYRDIEVDRSHPLSGALAELRRVANFDRIGLRGLTADEVQRMMSGIAGHDVPWGISEAVYRQTEGNPLFVQEVLRYLVEQGHFARGDGRSRRETPPEMGLPEGLRDVIGKRLSGLSDRCNSVLSIAAVIGREFSLQVLQGVAGLTEEDLYAALEEASGVGVVEERSSVGAVVGFRFSHAFFRQTLYEETFAPRRIRLHQQVGQALEEVYSARPDEHAAEMAEHFAHSSDEGGLAKALRYGEMAAGRAMSVYAHAEAARLLEQALQVHEVLDPDDRAKRCDLLLALGEVLMPAGESLRVYESVGPEAFVLAEAIGDDDRAAGVCELAVAAAHRYGFAVMSQKPEFRTWAERFDRAAAPRTRHRIHADLAISMIRRTTGQEGEAFKLRKGAVELARQLDDADSFVAAARWFILGDWAPQHQRERLELARKVADKYVLPAGEATGGEPIGISGIGSSVGVATQIKEQPDYFFLGIPFLQMGDRARAEEIWGRLKERAELTQDANLFLMVLVTDGLIAVLDGRLEEAVAIGERVTSRGQELGIHLSGQWLANLVSFVPLTLLGRTEELLARVDEFSETLRTMGLLRQVQAVVLANAGRVEEAVELSDRYIAEGAYGESEDETPSPMLLRMLETAVIVKDRETSEMLYRRLSVLSDMAEIFLHCVPRILGGAAALLGNHDTARSHYQTALELMSALRHRPEIALTRLELAELLLDHYPDERAEAMEHLDFAIGELRDMKMQPALERALSRREILGS